MLSRLCAVARRFVKMSTTACTAAGCFVKFTAHRLNQPYRFGLTAAALGRAFLRDRFWVAVAPMALAKSRSERSPSGFRIALLFNPPPSCPVTFTARVEFY